MVPDQLEFSASGGGKTLTFKTCRRAAASNADAAGGLDLDAVWVGHRLGSRLRRAAT